MSFIPSLKVKQIWEQLEQQLKESPGWETGLETGAEVVARLQGMMGRGGVKETQYHLASCYRQGRTQAGLWIPDWMRHALMGSVSESTVSGDQI